MSFIIQVIGLLLISYFIYPLAAQSIQNSCWPPDVDIMQHVLNKAKNCVAKPDPYVTCSPHHECWIEGKLLQDFARLGSVPGGGPDPEACGRILSSAAQAVFAKVEADLAAQCGTRRCPPAGWYESWQATVPGLAVPESIGHCLPDDARCDWLLARNPEQASQKEKDFLEKRCGWEPTIETACPEAKAPYLGFPRYTDQPVDPRTSSGAANIADLARLSYAAYRDNEHTVSRAAGGSFERERFERNIITGFDVATYIDRENRNAVISYRGTEPDDPRDLYTTFFLQFFDQFNLPPQFRQAVRYAEEEIARLQSEGYTVVVTGHSLGGAMSEVVHQVTGVTAVTFNPTAAPTRRWEENLFLQPVRRTGPNLLRVFNSDDIARETDYAHTEREGGSSFIVEYPTENRIDAHSMLKLAEFLGESYEEIEQGSGATAERCAE